MDLFAQRGADRRLGACVFVAILDGEKQILLD